MMIWTKKQKKTIFSATLLILTSATLAAIIVYKVTASNLEQQLDAYGAALSSQLAVTLTENMRGRDTLGLNVLLTEFVQKQYFEYASAYNADHQLLSQAGKRSSKIDYHIFTADISFQNENQGFVEVGVNPGIIHQSVSEGLTYLLFSHLLLALLFIFFYLRPDWFWKYLPTQVFRQHLIHRKRSEAPPFESSTENELLPQEDSRIVVIVIKTAPISRSENHLFWISRSLSLYGGEIQYQQPGDYYIAFSGVNSVIDTLCCALLIQTICMQMNQQNEFKAGIHIAQQENGEICRKHASYLASISKNSVLISREVKDTLSGYTDIKVSEYHDSAVSENQVYSLNSLAPETMELVEKQARQLVTQKDPG